MNGFITPGSLVRHPTETEWGIGQVQTVAGNRITVNFENAGKQVINAALIELIMIDPDPRG
jgi:transcription elongation factor GreA-like protein